MAKTYPTLITSPFGQSLWAHLIEADKKFSDLGDFKVNLKVGEAEAQGLIDQIQAEKEKALAFFQEEAKSEGKTAKAIAKIKLSDIDPFEEDDEEEDNIDPCILLQRDDPELEVSLHTYYMRNAFA